MLLHTGLTQNTDRDIDRSEDVFLDANVRVTFYSSNSRFDFSGEFFFFF